MAKINRTSGTSSTVYAYLQKYRNQDVHADDIAADTGLTHKQVVAAINNMRANRGFNIVTVQRGWYRFKTGRGTPVVDVKAKVKILTLLEDDRILLDIDGKLYVAEEREL